MKSSDRKSSRSSGQGPVGTCVSMFCPHKQPKKKNKPHPVMHSSKAATLATVANNAVVACCCRSLFASSASCSHLMLPDRHSSRLQSAYNNSSTRERERGGRELHNTNHCGPVAIACYLQSLHSVADPDPDPDPHMPCHVE